jgi:hypothetical protein
MKVQVIPLAWLATRPRRMANSAIGAQQVDPGKRAGIDLANEKRADRDGEHRDNPAPADQPVYPRALDPHQLDRTEQQGGDGGGDMDLNHPRLAREQAPVGGVGEGRCDRKHQTDAARDGGEQQQAARGKSGGGCGVLTGHDGLRPVFRCSSDGGWSAAGARAEAIRDARFIPGPFRGLKETRKTTLTEGRPA